MFTKVCEKERRSPAASPSISTKQGFYWGSLGKTRLVSEETRISQGERFFNQVAVSWIPAGETT
jgi:hypothetical protein